MIKTIYYPELNETKNKFKIYNSQVLAYIIFRIMR